MRVIMTIVFVTLFVSVAFAQQPEITIETGGVVPTVKIWHPLFTDMCKNLAVKIGVSKDATRLMLRPKPLLPSRERYIGEEWIASFENKEIIIKASELPEIFKGLRGPVAKNIFTGACYLKDNFFFSTEDMLIMTYDVQGANAIVSALKK